MMHNYKDVFSGQRSHRPNPKIVNLLLHSQVLLDTLFFLSLGADKHQLNIVTSHVVRSCLSG